MKEVRTWIEKTRTSLESAPNKKRPIHDQLLLREKTVADIAIQKSKLSISVEKLQLHFRSGVEGDTKITQAAEELLQELEMLHTAVKEQTTALETTLQQIEHYQLETLAADLETLRSDLVVTEAQLSDLPSEGLEAMMDALVKCRGDLKTHDLTAGCIREGILVLPQDEELETLKAEVDGLQKRIRALEEQVEAGQNKLKSSCDTMDERGRKVAEYHSLLEELEKWLLEIKLTLATDLNKDNAEEQTSVHQELLRDLKQRQKQLSELRSSCSKLETFEDVKDLASKLGSSLALLDTEIISAKDLTEDRLNALQDLLKVEPELAVSVQSLSPVAATYPVLISPVESPVHKMSKDDTIASNASPILDEEILIPSPLPLDIEEPKPELIALDFGTQTGRSLTLSPGKQIHTEVQTDSPEDKPSAIAIQTEDENWVTRHKPKGNIKILQTVEGNEETIEIATKSNVESDPLYKTMGTTNLGEDLTVELKYKENKEQEPIMTMSELNISHLEPQSFETVVMEPGESSTEIIVDADGTKRIIVRKTRRVISHHQRTLTSGMKSETADSKEIAFSQVTLQQQQRSVSGTLPDGSSGITTSQGYAGQFAFGLQGSITSSEFSNMPDQDVITYQTQTGHHDFENIPVDLQNQLEKDDQGTTEWSSASSTVRAVVHQVRRKIIRTTRRVIRKVVVIDGKEHVLEEVVEEPEEVEVFEEGIPRISIGISKNDHDGTFEDTFEEQKLSLQDPGVEISEITEEFPEQQSEDFKIQSDVVESEVFFAESPTEDEVMSTERGQYEVLSDSTSPVITRDNNEANSENTICYTNTYPVLDKRDITNSVNLVHTAEDDAELLGTAVSDEDVNISEPVYTPETKENLTKAKKSLEQNLKEPSHESDGVAIDTNKTIPKSSDVHSTVVHMHIAKNDEPLNLDDKPVRPKTKEVCVKEKSFPTQDIKMGLNEGIDVKTSSFSLNLKDNKSKEDVFISEPENTSIPIEPVLLLDPNQNTNNVIPSNSENTCSSRDTKSPIAIGEETHSLLQKHVSKSDDEEQPIDNENILKLKEKTQSPETTEVLSIQQSIHTESDNSDLQDKVGKNSEILESKEKTQISHIKDKADKTENLLQTKDNSVSDKVVEELTNTNHKTTKEATPKEQSKATKKSSTGKKGKAQKNKSPTTAQTAVEPQDTLLDRAETPLKDASLKDSPAKLQQNIEIGEKESKNVKPHDLSKQVMNENELFLKHERLPLEKSNRVVSPTTLDKDIHLDTNNLSSTVPSNQRIKEQTESREVYKAEIDPSISEPKVLDTPLNTENVPELESKITESETINPSLSPADGNSLLDERTLRPSDEEGRSKSNLLLKNQSDQRENYQLLEPNEEPEIKDSDKMLLNTDKQNRVLESMKVPGDKLSNIEIEICVKESKVSAKENIPEIASDTRVEPKDHFDNETMELVKQKLDVVLPGVKQSTTKRVTKKSESPLPRPSIEGSTNENKNETTYVDDLSTPSSLGESMEIIIQGSPNSSDTTKPTHQELFGDLSPRSASESATTYDTGYDGEDKTTFDESSEIDYSNDKNKKKKKKKQKLKVVMMDDDSSIEPKSSEFVPSDAPEEIVEPKETNKHQSKRSGKKPKKGKTVYHADTADEEVKEESVKDISEESRSDGFVKIVQDSIPTRPSSAVEEFQSTNTLTSVPVLEVIPTHSESAQTSSPVQSLKEVSDTVDISMQATEDTQDMFAQTSTPEMSTIDEINQTTPDELIQTFEEAVQTITPKAQSPVQTAEATIQTLQEEIVSQQEGEAQTDNVRFSSIDNVDSSVQTVDEAPVASLEETVQTSPEPDKVQSSSQVVMGDLVVTEEEGSQTVEITVPKVDFSTQIKASELTPVRDEFVQTTVEENISPSVIELADKKDEANEQLPGATEISSLVIDVPASEDKKDVSPPMPQEEVKTVNATSQTKPLKLKIEPDSSENTSSIEQPFKIEIEATVSYGPIVETETSISDESRTENGNEVQEPPSTISESTDSEASSWKSHRAKQNTSLPRKKKTTKQKEEVPHDKQTVALVKSNRYSPELEVTKEDENSPNHPDIKATVQFEVQQYNVSMKPELIAEISQEKDVSAIFIQAEINQSPAVEQASKPVLPGCSQVVELEMSSKHDGSDKGKPVKKSKKGRKIQKRSNTKALPEPSLVLGPEELRGEHSPGPPGNLRTNIDIDCGSNKDSISTTQDITFNIDFNTDGKHYKTSLDESRKPFDDNLLSTHDISQQSPKEYNSEISSLDEFQIDTKTIDSDTGDSVVEKSSELQTNKSNQMQKDESDENNDYNKTQQLQVYHEQDKNNDKTHFASDEEIPNGSEECLHIALKQVGNQLLDRLKRAQHPTTSTHMIYLASPDPSESSPEDKGTQLEDNLDNLQGAIQKQDITIIQHTLIITVDTISTWLESIEYKIQHTKHSLSHGTMSDQRLAELSQLQSEISQVESGVTALNNIVSQTDMTEPETQQDIRHVVATLQQQAAAVNENASATRSIADRELSRWEEFLNGVNNINVLVEQLRCDLEQLMDDQNTPAPIKLKKLEDLELMNRSHKAKCAVLLSSAHNLLRDFPGREIPPETYSTQDITQIIEHNICIEREKLLQLVSLVEEYEQTLTDFGQIIDVAEALVDGPIAVSNLQHLQEEMQKHRKFFVNLSHCRGILESLEGHLDPETRSQHSPLHNELHRRASTILDKAAGRAQQMALAASRWTVLEQGMKEERGWLQVANQRVPDLSSVSTTDFNQYISLYQALSSDIVVHAARISQLVCVAHGLQGLVQSESGTSYEEHHAAILALQTEVNTELGRLLAFRDSWTAYEILTDKLDAWVRSVQLDSAPSNMCQFWELKAQFELHKHVRDEAATHLDTALRVISVADETLQRQLQAQLLERWKALEIQLGDLQTLALESLSAGGGSLEDKLSRLERELTELATLLTDMHGVIKTEEELQLYIERLQVMRGSVEHIMEQLGCLGLLSAAECDRVGTLLGGARTLELSIREELEGATVLRDRLTAIRRGSASIRRDQQRAASVLDQCEASIKEGQDAVQQALINCQGVGGTLVTQWGELMALRQLLHTLPMSLRLSMSPVRVERDLAQLQDNHADLSARCKALNNNLAQRLALWRRFYNQLELVQQSVRETDYMMEILAVQGQVDYERLVKATERLEGLSSTMSERGAQVDELRAVAEPLQAACSPAVAQELEQTVSEAVAAWEDTVASLQGLCSRYQNAVQLWRRYEEASLALNQWADTAAYTQDPPQELKHIKVSEERLAELRALVSQIAADVGLDADSLLGAEVTALGHKLEDVRESLAGLVEAAEAKVQEQQLCAEDLRQANAFLTTVQKSLEDVDSSGGKGTLEQLSALRNHLIALGKTDGQIQALREKTADLPPAKQDISVLEILQLWQQVFRETFQQYHRLSARLVRDQDGLAALKLWQEYLLHVQAFLTSPIPDDYTSLSEHKNLCQVHQNLLSSQQSLLLTKAEPEATMELSVAEQFNSLTNLHNETLARIMEREAQVRSRMNIWEQYRNDHKAILAWLREIEKEKSRLKLRYVHMRMIPKTIQRIQSLLDKLPNGEAKAEKLGGKLTQLCQFCDDTLATSIKLEHTAVVDKISCMQAALQTWLGFLLGLQELTSRYEQEVESAQKAFSEVHAAVEAGATDDGNSACVPASYHRIQQRLDALKQAQERLTDLSKDLDSLGVTQEQLKESLNPMDMKTVNQRVWLLWQQHGELEQQLHIMCYQLEDKLKLGQMFDKRQERFLTWTTQVERRLESMAICNEGPSEVLRRLETELEAEVVLRRREVEWLRDTGQELVEAEGLDASPRRTNLKTRLTAVTEAWDRVEQLTSVRANKLRQIIEGMSTLEQRIEELRGWLHRIEIQLMSPVILEHCTEAGLNKCLTHHDALTKDIEQHSGIVGDVLNHCELLLNDCDSANVQLNTDGISTATQVLERRWKNVCVMVSERKARLMRTWQLLQEVLRLCEEQSEWLQTQTDTLHRIRTHSDSAHLQAVPTLINDVEKVITELECRRPALDLLQSSYTTLATQSSLENLTQDVRGKIAEWSALHSRAAELLKKLRAMDEQWRVFTNTQGAAVLALTSVDVQLTQIGLLDTDDDSDLETQRNKLKKLLTLKSELESHGELLKTADLLGLEVMNRCVPQDMPVVQQMVDEYQLLWKDIMERMKLLIEACKEEFRKRNVVNEEIQVETLAFETDSSVQVNTLPTPLLRRDEYVYELQTAIRECNTNLESLAAVEKITTKNAAKCVAACQSSVDLITHLSGLLLKQCGASPEEACSKQVEDLTRKYQQLLAQKQSLDREQQELSESGSFTCPLCTRRNWKQLDNDLWRLQKWLEFAEGTQASQHSPPSDINQLEEVIQDHREFLLDLDSHKSLVVSLSIVGKHLAEHTEDETRAAEMTERLAEIRRRWDAVCNNAAIWETSLQTTLLQNPEFHATVEELVQWLEQTEHAIQQIEPVDVSDGLPIIESKYNKFKDLRHDLEVCEPRVLSLQEAASHLLRHRQTDMDTTTCERLTHLRQRLHSLTRLTNSYLLKLGTVLGKDPLPQASLATLSHELLDQAAGGTASSRSSIDQLNSNSEGLVDTSVLARGYRFLGRVVRASLPIQALMLLLLGVASLVPITEEDFACGVSRAFGPQLRFVNGPPPM